MQTQLLLKYASENRPRFILLSLPTVAEKGVSRFNPVLQPFSSVRRAKQVSFVVFKRA